jgi:hypothetical protein
MTPQENQALQTLLSQLTQVKGITKDPQAEAMIADAVARQPDAAYLLVQRSMILEQALDAAKAQISDLQKQLQHAQPQDANKNFLDANSWGNTGADMERSVARADTGAGTERSVTGAEIPANMPRQNAVPAPNAARAASPGFLGGGAGSMLGTMAATAAGVAGGAFLFQGIGNLLGNHPQQVASEHLDKKEAAPANAAENDASAQNPDTALNNDMEPADDTTTDDLFASDSGFDDGSFDV